MKRKIKLTVSRLRRERVVTPQPPLLIHCRACGREVELVSAAQAADVLEVSAGALDALAAAGRVHAFETVSGQQKFCKDSLFARSRAATG